MFHLQTSLLSFFYNDILTYISIKTVRLSLALGKLLIIITFFQEVKTIQLYLCLMFCILSLTLPNSKLGEIEHILLNAPVISKAVASTNKSPPKYTKQTQEKINNC